MLKIFLIRHSQTLGNLHKRYIGRTDEDLCKEGIELLNSRSYPKAEAVYCSPLKRCIQTAQIIYSCRAPFVKEELRECDFGNFENKNYLELTGDLEYQAWVDSNGTMSFPGGENPFEFRHRCVRAFQQIIEESVKKQYDSIAVIAHGGTIMSIMESLACPEKEYYEWHVENAKGYCVEWDKENGKMTLKYEI